MSSVLFAAACVALALSVISPKPLFRIEQATHTRTRDGPIDTLAVAADIDLFAACIRAGLSTAHAAGAVAHAASSDHNRSEHWRNVHALLAIGVSAHRAWEPMRGVEGLSDLAALAAMSERSGGALSAGCARISTKLRADNEHAATAAAERAGVLIALPLTVCFLPAFFILGLAPTVISLATTMLN